MKLGSCFFWLAATGLAVLVISLAGAVGLSVGQGTDLAATDTAGNVTPIGIGGAIALLVVVFASYWAGGYVAGRMARFSGARQGLGVWLWVVLTVVLTVIAAIAGTQIEVWDRLQSLPQVTVNANTLSTVGIVTPIGIVVVSLVGAVLGGLSGMHHHRTIDKTGIDVVLADMRARGEHV